LRDLVSLPPPELPVDLWEKYVAGATFGPPTTELNLDSAPANAQISVNFHGEGVTPRTLKVPKGTVYVEVQKDGFRKAFRRLEVGLLPVRAVFRLIERTHDRGDQALTSLGVLRQTEPTQRPQTLSRLAQLARADTLVVSQIAGERVRIWFFDAERGAVAKDAIDSPFDPQTGRIAVLAARPTPAAAAVPKPTAALGIPAPPATPPADTAKPTSELPFAQAQQASATVRRRKRNPAAPWWSWAIAGLLGASLGAFIVLDRPERKNTLAVRAFWTPPSPGP
jgi:hypothetical protein